MITRFFPITALSLFFVITAYANDTITIKNETIENAAPSEQTLITPAELFTQAVTNFKGKRYHQAIELFLVAKRRGMSLPKLHFNLGSAYYKIKRYNDAINAFKIASKDSKYSVLSGINIALCLQKMSQPQQATLQLNRVIGLTNNKKYLHLIQRISKQYNLSLQHPLNTAYWHSEYSMFYGVNDNDIKDRVLLQNETNVNDQNEFLQFSVFNSYQSIGLFNLRLSLQSTSYAGTDPDDFNYIQINIEPQLRLHSSQWRYTLTAIYQPSSLGGKLYLTTYELRNTLIYQLNSLTHLGTSFSKYKYDNRSMHSEHLAGQAIKRKIFIGYKSKDVTFTLNGHSQDENRSDYYENPTDQQPSQSFSPRRREFSLQTRMTIRKGTQIELSLQHRRSKYPKKRTDDRKSSRISIYHKLTKTHWVSLTSTKIKNVSENKTRDSTYDYRSNSYLIGFSGSF